MRLIVYDQTCRSRFGLGLSAAWSAGAALYRARGVASHARGVTSFQEALSWLAQVEHQRAIDEIQFWGHGKWGALFIGREKLERSALAPAHALRPKLEAVRERVSPDTLWWFRTCETFGAERGQDFARAWSDWFGCAAAGHTYVIGVLQSGLHRLKPGQTPPWSSAEGLLEGSAREPVRARTSSPLEPNTISCLQSRFPDGF